YPNVAGFAERDGVRLAYEVYGDTGPTIFLVPTWQIVHSRLWKAQIPYLARYARVVTFDPRGNGKSDRPQVSAAYDEREMAADIIAVMDATSTERAVLVTRSMAAQRGLIVAADHPDRVEGLIAGGPSLPIGMKPAERTYPFEAVLDTEEGWAKHNIHSWRRDFDAYLQFFFSRCFTEPHSTKQIEDCVEWGHEIGPETLIVGQYATELDAEETLALCARVRCPVLVVVGDQDAVTGPGPGIALAGAIAGAQLVTVEGGGHVQDARDPVLINLLIRDFVAGIHPGFGRPIR
ncbi:MAG TPA: alpha/beta hydrolase, partial [Methylomirabilota bacterium]|nr:alpha/beta hydrolase [Methylomirabilota bacterium]